MGNLEENLQEIENLNQRGGRMLSIIDLIERETISLDLAVYLMVAIQSGVNFLIGAEPGGAGKTTVMGALLGLLPETWSIKTIPNENATQNLSKGTPSEPIVYVIHEIGDGNWYGYLWGKPVVNVLRQLEPNTYLASNLHPDTLPKVRGTFERFGVSQKEFLQLDFLIFLHYDRLQNSHVINEVWESNRHSFNCIQSSEKSFTQQQNNLRFNDQGKLTHARAQLELCLQKRILRLEEVANAIYHQK